MVLSRRGVLEIRFESPGQSESLFQRARDLTVDVLLGEIACVTSERILVGVQPFPDPRNRVRTYKKLVPPNRVVDEAGVVQREITIDGVYTVWLAVTRPSALVQQLACEMACDSLCPVLFVGTTVDADALNVAADMIEASLERGNLIRIRMGSAIASALRGGWMVGARDVDWYGSYSRVRIFGPREALEAPRRLAEFALLR